MLFGLMSLALFMMIGVAIDYGRWLNARNQTIAATDAAVLAAARALQTNGGNQTDALNVAKTYYAQATQARLKVKNDTITFAVTDNATAIVTTGNAYISTPFMALGHVPSLPILHANGIDYSKAVLAVGGNSATNLEIGLMLDISGSMNSGTKLADMKSAANSLVDTVIWANQSQYTSRLAIVPFSGDVMPTSSLLAAATNPTYSSSISLGSGSSKKTYYPTKCVAERSGSQAYTDALPGTNRYVLREYGTPGSGSPKMASCVIDASGMLRPMTSDKTVLHSKINSLVAGGSTAGHVGTAWTYYMISPKWASKLPSGSQPVAYGTTTTKKIAVLMTDGAYNMEHDSHGVTVGSTGAGSSVNGTASATQAQSICTDMKNNGIEIYTIGFDLSGNSAQDQATALATLSNCASDASHFYNSETGDQLKAAFNDISLKISTLYLAN
jgi:Flp pilus assembly protein TadG